MTTASEIMEKATKPAAGEHSPSDAAPDVRAARPVAPRPRLGQATQVGSVRLTEEQASARRARSIAIALALGAFVAVIFAVTVVKLGSGVFTGPSYMRPVQAQK
jgi:hypothetical protein